MKSIKKCYILFLSPGILFSEQTEKEINDCDFKEAIKKAIKLSQMIKERHGAKPYGFQFITRLGLSNIEDEEGNKFQVEEKEIRRSGIYFLGGFLRYLHDVERGNREDEQILISNMKGNGWPIVIQNNNSYKSTLPFTEKDVLILDGNGDELIFGNDKNLVEYRKKYAKSI